MERGSAQLWKVQLVLAEVQGYGERARRREDWRPEEELETHSQHQRVLEENLSGTFPPGPGYREARGQFPENINGLLLRQPPRVLVDTDV